MINIQIFVTLRKGHPGAYFNLFVIKYLLREIVTVDQFLSPHGGEIDIYLK